MAAPVKSIGDTILGDRDDTPQTAAQFTHSPAHWFLPNVVAKYLYFDADFLVLLRGIMIRLRANAVCLLFRHLLFLFVTF